MLQTAQLLRSKGLKVTPQRIAVYNMLKTTTQHPNAEMIYKALEEENPTMSLATVYKTLDYFKQCGLVQELNVGDSSARYDALTDCHAHMVCLECGCVDDLFIPELVDIHKQVESKMNFAVEYEQFIMYGKCTDCKAKVSGA